MKTGMKTRLRRRTIPVPQSQKHGEPKRTHTSIQQRILKGMRELAKKGENSTPQKTRHVPMRGYFNTIEGLGTSKKHDCLIPYFGIILTSA